jgi:hypothetical protein
MYIYISMWEWSVSLINLFQVSFQAVLAFFKMGFQLFGPPSRISGVINRHKPYFMIINTWHCNTKMPIFQEGESLSSPHILTDRSPVMLHYGKVKLSQVSKEGRFEGCGDNKQTNGFQFSLPTKQKHLVLCLSRYNFKQWCNLCPKPKAQNIPINHFFSFGCYVNKPYPMKQM